MSAESEDPKKIVDSEIERWLNTGPLIDFNDDVMESLTLIAEMNHYRLSRNELLAAYQLELEAAARRYRQQRENRFSRYNHIRYRDFGLYEALPRFTWHDIWLSLRG